MARSKRSSRQADRDHYSISSLLAPPSVPSSPIPLSYPIEDRRQYYPEPDFGPALSFGSIPAEVTSRPIRRSQKATLRSYLSPEVQAFKLPRGVAICIRRKQRREVLFAKKRTRSGRGRSKRRNLFSGVSC